MKQDYTLGRDMHESKISSIQVLRGVAALIVTIYHLKNVMAANDPFRKEIDFLFNSGPAGVSLFFVISGFIMVYVTRNMKPTGHSILYFLTKRIVRIWPAYAIISIFYCYLQSRQSPGDSYMPELVMSLLFVPVADAPPPFYGYATLNVGWSLNYEIYFYLLLTVSMFFRRFRWLVFFVLIGITLVVVPLYFGFFTFKADQPAHFALPYFNMATNPIIWNFVYGVLIGLAYNNATTYEWLSGMLSQRWVARSIVAVVIWQALSGFLGGFGPFEWGAGSMAIFVVFVFHYQRQNYRFPAWLVRMGDISFSIYLLHVPIAVTLGFLFRKFGYPVYSTGTALFILSIALTIIVSHASHQYLEVRLSARILKWLHIDKAPRLKTSDLTARVEARYPQPYRRHHS